MPLVRLAMLALGLVVVALRLGEFRGQFTELKFSPNLSVSWTTPRRMVMARMPRLVVPGFPHHVTQRGNRRMKTFFNGEDHCAYLDLLSKGKAEAGVSVWAYCLMLNHVHLVVIPGQKDSLAKLFRFVHRHYSRRINFRENWRGHLWHERFHSFVMDEATCLPPSGIRS